MNLFLKYAPIAYTFNTRLKTLIDKIYYFGTDLGMFSLAAIYLGILGDFSLGSLIQNLLLLVYIYIVYMIFYEVGYIHNDCFVIEKKKTQRIIEKCSKKFWHYQILSRIVLGFGLLLLLNYLSHVGFLWMLLNIAIMEIIFLIHNLIRNYSINIFSRLLLRLSKLSLFLIFLVFIKQTELIAGLSPIVITVLMFHIMDLFTSRYSSYNRKLGGENVLKYGYTYIFIMIIFLFLSVIFQDLAFCLPLIILIPKATYFVANTKNVFSIKDDR